MTQVELAILLGVTPQTVSRMLHTANMKTGTLERICEVMNVPITFFYDEHDIDAVPADSTDAVIEDTEGTSKFWQTCRIGDKVRRLLRSQHKRMGALCHYIGMSAPGLHNVFDRNTCKITVLLKMAEFFNVPVTYFLPEDKREQEERKKDCEIQYLKGQLKAYEHALATVLQGMKGAENIDLSAILTASELQARQYED